MYTSYYCEKCKNFFGKVGAFKEKTPCTFCESKNTILNPLDKFLENTSKTKEKDEKKK